MVHQPKLAFIGVGVMGGAILSAIVKQGHPGELVNIYEKNIELGQQVAADLGVQVAESASAAASSADVLVLAVKPQFLTPVLEEIRDAIAPETIVVSIAAGKTIAYFQEYLGADVKIVRLMPNTPALIGRGVGLISPAASVTEAEVQVVEELFSATGVTTRIDENLQNAGTALSGSGPAYVFYLIDALAEAATLQGIPRAQSLQIAKEMVAGAAELALQSDTHPVVLREQVSSPAGTTIAAIREFDAHGVRAAVMDAVEAARVRGDELA